MDITWAQAFLLYWMLIISSPLEKRPLQLGKVVVLIPIVVLFKLAGGWF